MVPVCVRASIRQEVDDQANIIFGSAFDESLNGRIRVSVVATGLP
jgi:cell division protein FtsZ